MRRNILLLLVLCITLSFFTVTAQVKYPKDFISPDMYKSNHLPQSYKQSSDNFHELPIVKENFMVNTIGGSAGAEQMWPSIGKNLYGEYLAVWLDGRSGRKEVFAQLFDNNGIKLGNNFRLSEDNCDWNSQPAISSFSNGDFLITWLPEPYVVSAKRVTRQGSVQTLNWQLYGGVFNEPSLAIDKNDNILLTYISGYDPSKVAAVLYDSSGALIKRLDQINRTPGFYLSSSGLGKKAAVDTLGNFVVTWSERSTSEARISLQVIDKLGNYKGDVISVSVKDSSNPVFPRVSAVDGGNFMVVWNYHTDNHSTSGVAFRILDSNGSFVNSQVKIDSAYTSDISSDSKSRFMISYAKKGTYSIITDKDGNFISEKHLLNELGNIPDYWIYSTGFSDNKIGFISSYYIKEADIYFTLFSDALSQIRMLKVNDDSCSSWQTKPCVKFLKNGKVLTVWNETKNGRKDLYAQLYDNQFNPVGGDICLNDNPGTGYYHSIPSIESFSDGSTAIAFNGSDYYGYGELYIQLLNSQGERIGTNKLIKQYAGSNVLLKVNNKDQLLVCNINGLNQEASITIFDKNLAPVQNEVLFLKKEPGKFLYPLAFSANNDFSVCALWRYHDSTGSPEPYVYYSVVNNNGVELVKAVIDSTIYNNNYPYTFKTLIDDQNNIAFFIGKSYGLEYKRIYKNGESYTTNFSARDSDPSILSFINYKSFVSFYDGNRIIGYSHDDHEHEGQEFLLHNYESIDRNYEFESYDQHSEDIYDGNLFLSFTDNLPLNTGYNIWAKVLSVEDLNFDDSPHIINNDNILYQNYPNPFNPFTAIKYRIKTAGNIKINIYDILGRKVHTLIDSYHTVGSYVTHFVGDNFSSGVYICRMEGSNTVSRKLLLVK